MIADLINHYATEVARKIAADQDALIRRCISARIGWDWTDDSIIPRLRWEIDQDKPEKMLLLDNEPLLLLWPPIQSTEYDREDGRSMMNWTINYLKF